MVMKLDIWWSSVIFMFTETSIAQSFFLTLRTNSEKIKYAEEWNI